VNVKQEKKRRADEGDPRPAPGSDPQVSLVVPIWNEEGVLPALYQRSHDALEGMGGPWEIVFVDDGSTDGSGFLLRSLHARDPRVRVLFLSRNFGQHAALNAGLESARGEVVVIMDGDLQLSPEDIPCLVSKVREGYDLVGGWRVHRRDSSLRRKIPSLVFNLVLSRSTGVKLKDFNCGFKAMNRRLVEDVKRRGDERLYLAPLLVELAERVTEIPVAHGSRPTGKSKYTLMKSLALIFRFLKFSIRGPGLMSGDLPVGVEGRTSQAAHGKRLQTVSGNSANPLFEIRETLSRG